MDLCCRSNNECWQGVLSDLTVSTASDILGVSDGGLFGRSVGYEVHFVSGLTLKF